MIFFQILTHANQLKCRVEDKAHIYKRTLAIVTGKKRTGKKHIGKKRTGKKSMCI